MSGIGLVLSIAKDALSAQKYGINVTAHNIANVNTEGYSRQYAVYEARQPAPYGGMLLGRGVDTTAVLRASDQFIENRLMQQKSTMFSSKEMENYMQILEGLFSEDSEMSISAMLTDFWNSWHDIANNPSGAPERIALYEHSILLSEQFNNLDADLKQLETNLTNALRSGIGEINEITAEIVQINGEIARTEGDKTANDLRDTRNMLVSELSEYLDVKTFEQSTGALTVITTRGYVLVTGDDTYDLKLGGDDTNRVLWQGSQGATADITDYLTNGKLGGWLDIRDEVIAKYKLDLDALAKEFIWAINQQHSQGVGLKLFSGDVTGKYKTGTSGLLSTLTYGQEIDYTKDFRMWIEDNNSSPATLSDVTVDMGISSASLTNWAGTATGATQYKYVFTVTTAGTVGADTNVTETDGVGLGVVQTGDDVSDALDSAIAGAQTITVKGGPGGDQTVTIADSGADATRSAKDIARALSVLNGVAAYASDNSATIDITNVINNVQANDVVSFTLSSGGSTAGVSFTVSSTDATTRSNFLIALNTAITTINGTGSDLSIDGSKLTSDNLVTITSASGKNIGIEDFDVEDLAVATLDNFQNLNVNTEVDIDTFTNFSNGESVTFSITTAQGSVNITYTITDDTDQTTLAADFEDALDNAAGLAALGVTYSLVGGTVTITGDAAAAYLDFEEVTAGPGNDESFDITTAAGTQQYPVGGDDVLLFDDSGDLEQYAGDNQITFTVNVTDSITVDLRRVDTTDNTAVATAFYNGLNGNLTDATVTDSGGSVTITATAESASDFAFSAGMENGAVGNATMDIAVVGAAPASDTFTFNNADTASFTSVVETDTMGFGTETLTETGGAGDEGGVKTGTITVFLDPGLTIESDIAAAAYSLFNVGAGTAATTGNSIITLGGDDGFTGFGGGDTISFNVDGNLVDFTIAGEVTDLQYATGLQAQLVNDLAAFIPATYSIIRHGASVSILKHDDTPIEITDFEDDDGSGADNSATLAVSTGTGVGVPDPANTLLDASDSNKTSATSTLYGSEGVILWAQYDATGTATATSGTIDVDDADPFTVDGLTFDIGAGTLVAGNTFTINTKDDGSPDKLVLTPATGTTANSVSDTYTFKVTTGGTIGNGTPVITWSNSVDSGTITITAADDYTVDGMTLSFTSGTLLADDVFTITTNATGTPTANLPSNWHWTLESFKDEFNNQATGVTASVTSDNALKFSPASGYSLGFCDRNFDDCGLLAALGINTFFDGSSAGSIGTNAQIANKDYIAAGKINNNVGMAVLATGNTSTGSITTAGPYTGADDATYTIRIEAGGATFKWKKDAGAWSAATNISIGSSQTINEGVTLTFNPGTYVAGEAFTIAVTASTDPSQIHATGDNSNALAMTDLQYASTDIAQWTCDRTNGKTKGTVNETFEVYYHAIVGTIGTKSASVSRGRAFNEAMVSKLGEIRDSISAVSLDEEMINLIKFQYAYAAAARLISVSDEMLDTLLSVN
jgi:flagellar hook-associated protein 1 FlgK